MQITIARNQILTITIRSLLDNPLLYKASETDVRTLRGEVAKVELSEDKHSFTITPVSEGFTTVLICLMQKHSGEVCRYFKVIVGEEAKGIEMEGNELTAIDLIFEVKEVEG